jgi:hypothetical protein
MNVDFSTLYILSREGKRGAFSAKCAVTGTADARLALLTHLLWGIQIPKALVPFRWAEGSRLYDLLESTIPSYIVSGRLLDVLEAAGATGWSRYSIELHGKANELIEGYSGLVVVGRSGPLQLDRSRVETRIGASGKPYKVKIGLYFDEATWDATDVFSPQGTAFVFVTDKVKRALEKAKISNMTFTSLNDHERQW